LVWDYNCKTIHYDKHNNLPDLYTTPGGSNAAAFLAQNMDPFPSLYANRHSLPFATPYSDNPSIIDKLISTTDANNQPVYTPKHKRQKHNTDTNIQFQSNDLTIEKITR
jgi:hypothetical protein